MTSFKVENSSSQVKQFIGAILLEEKLALEIDHLNKSQVKIKEIDLSDKLE